MRTGLTKRQKTTVIYFNEHSRLIEVGPVKIYAQNCLQAPAE